MEALTGEKCTRRSGARPLTDRPGGAEAPVEVSVIVPTLNEAGNIGPLLSSVEEGLAAADVSAEILIADGGSIDGTRAEIESARSGVDLRWIDADSGRGLAGDVLVAARHARAEVVVVMDADGSHDAEALSRLVRPVLTGARDMVIGSRYVPGGGTDGWPAVRRLVSRAAAILAWPWTEVRDPTSGFFAVRRQRLLAVDPQARGFKIGLEILLTSADDLRVEEVPIRFRDRARGVSKMSLATAGTYLARLAALAGGAVTSTNARRFALVGVLGWIVDLAAFELLWRTGSGLAVAHVSSFLVAAATNFALDSRWAFRSSAEGRHGVAGYGRFFGVAVLALLVRGGVLALAYERLGWSPALALCAAISVAAAINYLGCAFYVFPPDAARGRSIAWRTAAVGITGYALLLRAVYLGLPDLMPQEAYYWNYAQHPALSYLDHPPMIAWMIRMGTALLGDTELGVRFGAYLCWLVAAGFVFALARNLYDKETALKALMLVAALPFFLSTGFLAMPDAPLVACWAGALFFLERALLAERRLAWWGVGLCLGLGALSKYTIGLVALAILVFVLLDRRSRRWLARPEPYAGALLAIGLFLPVIVWNIRHDWASFVFQSARRLNEPPRFGLDGLFESILVLITPVCVLAALGLLVALGRERRRGGEAGSARRRRRLFVTAMTLVPLVVFVLFSLRHDPKLNWTGPLWLALLPTLAHRLPTGSGAPATRFAVLGRRAWAATLIGTLLGFGGLLHYLTLGFPGIPLMAHASLPVAMEELGAQVEAIEDRLEEARGLPDGEILVVGMNKYFLASSLAFYRRHGHEGSEQTASENLFGNDALMYEYWYPPERQRGRTLLLVSFDRRKLTDERVGGWVAHLGPIRARMLEKDGHSIRPFYFRIAEDYEPAPQQRSWRLASRLHHPS